MMGYSTDFEGSFKVDPPMKPEHIAYLKQFSETRRMDRDRDMAAALPDPIRMATNLDIGSHGEYFVGAGGLMGQDKDASVINYNRPPPTQPGLWCQWVPTPSGNEIVWNGGEKFYDYVEWITYIITKFMNRWMYDVNGEVKWQGEDSDDFGKIIITNNIVEVKRGKKVYED